MSLIGGGQNAEDEILTYERESNRRAERITQKAASQFILFI
jgi:hypothetical protein